MALVDPWPSFRQALVRQLRSNLVLEDELPGGWSEGVAPQGTDFPRGVYQLHFAPMEYDWTGVVTLIGFDVVVFSKDQGEAGSLSLLVFTTLQDAMLDVAGQTILSCRRTGPISLADVDAEGNTIFEMGGTYAARTAQSNPSNQSITVTLTSTIG